MYPLELILASASPRRRELLQQIAVPHTVQAADIDEVPRAAEKSVDYVQRMAREKAETVAARCDLSRCAVLAADTIVTIDGDILGKPSDQLDGLSMLARLSGRKHQVMTAVCLHSADAVSCELVSTEVQFMQLNRAQCEAYLATGEPWDKAGAYGIQGLGAVMVQSISGSYSNVVGLPLHETWRLLSDAGLSAALQYRDE